MLKCLMVLKKLQMEVYEGEINIQTLGKLDHNLNSLEPVTEATRI